MFCIPAYKRYMAIVQPSYNPPTAKTVKKYLHIRYLEEKGKLISELKGQVAVGLTADTWTSKSKKGYITGTGHYIIEDWILKSCVLATRRITGNHTGEHIYNSLFKIEQEFKIQEKVAGLTSGNASNMKSAGSKHYFCTDIDAHCCCFAHTLQLAINDGLKAEEIKYTAGECRSLRGHFSMSNLASNALEDFQKQQGIKVPLTLMQDVKTRWNSTYLMFEILVKFKSAISYVLHEKKYTKSSECEKLELKPSDWKLLGELLPVME